MDDKQLLIQDLTARIKFGVYVLADNRKEFDGGIAAKLNGIIHHKGQFLIYIESVLTPFNAEEVKPYLRPLTSMTQEEKNEMHDLLSPHGTAKYDHAGISTPATHYGDYVSYDYMNKIINYLYSKHFDINDLIKKNMAIDCTSLQIYD